MQTSSSEKAKLTPQEVRNILNIDNKEIVNLCKKAFVVPKKNSKGQTYFLLEEVVKLKEFMKKTQKVPAASKKTTQKTASAVSNIPVVPVSSTGTAAAPIVPKTSVVSSVPSEQYIIAVKKMFSQLKAMEQRLSNNVAKVIDEKLDGMDEVVVELIRCKTENESLRQKLNEFNKENYHLKKEINSYKSVGLGLYVKKKTDEFDL